MKKVKTSTYILALFVTLAILTLTVSACIYFRDVVKGEFEEEQAVIALYRVAAIVCYVFDFALAGLYAAIRMKEAKELDANALRNVKIIESDGVQEPVMLVHVDNVAVEKVVIKVFKNKYSPVDAIGTVNNND